MKLFRIPSQNILASEELTAPEMRMMVQPVTWPDWVSFPVICNCSSPVSKYQCFPGFGWIQTQKPCYCPDYGPEGLSCDESDIGNIFTTEGTAQATSCLNIMSNYSCLKFFDNNGCVQFGRCGESDCIRPCLFDDPCESENPCCSAFLFCDSDPSSSTCGQCITEQGGDPSDCFNCPECDSSLCDGTDPPDPPDPDPPDDPPPPSPPGPEPPCRKYTSGTYEIRDGIWTCVDKITRQEIGAECCDLPPFTPTITVTNTTGPTSTPTTIGPTPEPETNDPCADIALLGSVVDNIVLFEQLCNCKCYARYTCFNGVCVEDATGSHDSYLSCLNYLCDGGECGNSLPNPTPLPQYVVCQDPLIINQ